VRSGKWILPKLVARAREAAFQLAWCSDAGLRSVGRELERVLAKVPHNPEGTSADRRGAASPPTTEVGVLFLVGSVASFAAGAALAVLDTAAIARPAVPLETCVCCVSLGGVVVVGAVSPGACGGVDGVNPRFTRGSESDGGPVVSGTTLARREPPRWQALDLASVQSQMS